MVMRGFTLAELLMALLIIGEIATFTIPKVINATTNGQNKSISKETASMVSGAFSTYQLRNGITSTVKGSDLTQYMNYIKIDTSTTFFAGSGTALQQCSSTLPCMTLHTGGVLQYDTAMTLGGTATTNAVYFNLDPDGNGAQGRVTFIQFYTGRLSSGGVGGTATPLEGHSLVKIPIPLTLVGKIMAKPMFIRDLKVPISIVGMVVLALLSLFLIVQNADYSRNTIVVPIRSLSMGQAETIDSLIPDDKAGWKLVSLEYDFKNPTYFNVKSLKRRGHLVSFWKKRLYDVPSAIKPNSKRMGALVYESQEFYEADCQANRVKGPITGYYWGHNRQALLEPKTHQKLWAFSAQWKFTGKVKPEILWNVCEHSANARAQEKL